MSSPSITVTKKGHGKVTWPTSNFEAPNDISGMAKARIVKFCIQVVCIKSYVLGDKPPLKGRGQVTLPFSVLTPAIISLERLRRELWNCVRRWNISSASLQMTDYPLIGLISVTWPFFKILPQSYLCNWWS